MALEQDTILAVGLDVALQDFSEIPLVDFAGFRDGSARRALAQQIGRAARGVGLLCVANHGVPDAHVAPALRAELRPRALLSYNETSFLWSEPPAGQRLADPDLSAQPSNHAYCETGHPSLGRSSGLDRGLEGGSV